ncbi:glycosyl hydrolase family 28-related protein [Agrobacterium tumefaciens]|uniref:glycosyl hydrolase family 28-related protein n=1 Tax=Agrobacterium tumefaciens TaxID=358 RepID=UPI001F42F196|nr:glycoside hydrolase family 28 protein [Agrobacterium tumefaciens]
MRSPNSLTSWIFPVVLVLALSGLPLSGFAFSGVVAQPAVQGGQEPGSQPDPRQFGFPIPVPEPRLPDDADAFNPPWTEVGGEGPAIAEISRTAGADEVVSMTGVDLDGRTGFQIFSQAPGATQGVVTPVAPLTADATAATLLLPTTLASWSTYLIRPQRGDVQGRSFAINRTESWWIGPDAAAPGAVVSVYGRNLSRFNGTSQSYLYIKPAGAAGWYVPAISVNPFKVDFKVPALPPGKYEVWAHNTHGGRFGWSGPLALDVLSQSPWAAQDKKRINAGQFGATGDGMTDDTAAILRAIDAAAATAPSVLYFPAGIYLVTKPLTAPGNVAWLGEGADNTEIRLNRRIDQSMVVVQGDYTRFEKLTLNANRNIAGKPLLALRNRKNIRLDSVRIDAWGVPAFDAQDTEGLFVHASELIENGSFYGASRQVFFSDNRFRMTGYGESVVALWGGRDFAMTGNELTNADERRDDGHGIGRFFVGQAHFGSMRNLYFEKNISRNAAPHDCTKVDCNKGEQICFEIVGSKLKNDFVGASSTSVTFSTLSDLGDAVPGGRDLVIVGGRGAGQHRHIVSTDGSTVLLEQAWNIVPDRTSRFALAATASRAVIYDNTFEGRGSYAEHDSDSTAVLLYGNVYDVVVDSNRISRMRHGMMTVALDSTRGLSPYFLQYSNNSVARSNSGLYVGTTFADTGVAGIWGGLGNVYRRNRFTDIAYIGVEYETWNHAGADYNGTVFDGNTFTNVRYGFVDAYKLMWTHDGSFKAGPAERSRRINTVLYDNHFTRGPPGPVQSSGFVTMHPDNSWANIGSTWSGFATGNAGPTANTVKPSSNAARPTSY